MSDGKRSEREAPQKRSFGVSNVLGSFLDSPLSGIAPWILLSVIGSPVTTKPPSPSRSSACCY